MTKLRKLPLPQIAIALAGIAAFTFAQFDLVERLGIDENAFSDFLTLFLSVVVEAFPFVVLGTIVSVLIALFMDEKFVLRILPKNRFISHPIISLTGMFFPVCECGNVPVARRLIIKGFSFSHAITFLLAAPILNPITLLTTWQAFSLIYPGGEALIFRIIGGFVIANFVGILFSFKKDNNYLTEEFEALCEHDHHDHGTKTARATRIFRTEFLEVMRMLVIGAAIAALIQTIVPRDIITSVGENLFLSVVAMMLFAFTISICSNIDAFVVLPYVNQFSLGAIVAYLVYGPMIDFKILTILKSTFKTHFLIILTGLVTLMSLSYGLLLNLLL